jgi:hypothetical protein
MKTIQLSLFFLTLCCFNSLFAQEEIGNGMLFPKFEKGIVVFKNGTRTSASLNYSMIQQEMLFLNPDSTMMAIANPLEVIVVIIGERRFLPVSQEGVFYEEIQAGAGSFFVQRKATMLSEGKASGYGGYSQTSAITSYGNMYNKGRYVKLDPDEKFRIKTENIFYLKSGESYKKFFTAKALGKLFKGHEKDIEEFANKQSVNFSKIDDITRIIEYGYSLMNK